MELRREFFTHLAFRGHPNVSSLSDELTVDPFFSAGIDVFTVSQNNEHEKRFGFYEASWLLWRWLLGSVWL